MIGCFLFRPRSPHKSNKWLNSVDLWLVLVGPQWTRECALCFSLASRSNSALFFRDCSFKGASGPFHCVVRLRDLKDQTHHCASSLGLCWCFAGSQALCHCASSNYAPLLFVCGTITPVPVFVSIITLDRAIVWCLVLLCFIIVYWSSQFGYTKLIDASSIYSASELFFAVLKDI